MLRKQTDADKKIALFGGSMKPDEKAALAKAKHIHGALKPEELLEQTIAIRDGNSHMPDRWAPTIKKLGVYPINNGQKIYPIVRQTPRVSVQPDASKGKVKKKSKGKTILKRIGLSS